MSPIVSRPRRRLPAISTRSTPSVSSSHCWSSMAIGAASPRRTRPPLFSMNSRLSRILARVFSPMRGSSSSEPSASFALSEARSTTPASFHMRRTVLGPSPGTASTSGRPGGTSLRSFSRSLIEPVASHSRMRFALPSPIPSTDSSVPGSSAIEATSVSRASSARATRAWALTRNPFAPVSSSSAAISSKSAARVALADMGTSVDRTLRLDRTSRRSPSTAATEMLGRAQLAETRGRAR